MPGCWEPPCFPTWRQVCCEAAEGFSRPFGTSHFFLVTQDWRPGLSSGRPCGTGAPFELALGQTLSLRQGLRLRLRDRTFETVIGDVDVAERRQNEGVVDANVVGQSAFRHRDNALPPQSPCTSRPEPFPVSGPRPSMPKVKMLGNITELKSPTQMMVPMASQPVLAMEVSTSRHATTATVPSTVRGGQLLQHGCADEAADHRP